MTTRNDDCNTCGGFGFTVESNGEQEFQTGCFDCFVDSHEADDIGSQIDRIMAKGLMVADGSRRIGIVDIAKMSDGERRRLAA